jgi:hypothetical protein
MSEKASGAHTNKNNSKVMAISKWETSANVLKIPYCTGMETVGLHFTWSINRFTDTNWVIVAGQRTQAKDAYVRNLCMDNRIQYIHNYLLARAWYMAKLQVVPRPTKPWQADRCSVSQQLGALQTHSFSFLTNEHTPVEISLQCLDSFASQPASNLSDAALCLYLSFG